MSEKHSWESLAWGYPAFHPYTPNQVRHRKRTTSAQLRILEGVFKRDTKPDVALREELATQLDMTARGVQVWFQNRRAKQKTRAAEAAAVRGAMAASPHETNSNVHPTSPPSNHSAGQLEPDTASHGRLSTELTNSNVHPPSPPSNHSAGQLEPDTASHGRLSTELTNSNVHPTNPP
ncbi:Homeodomain-like protein, partial [Mycena amicta]